MASNFDSHQRSDSSARPELRRGVSSRYRRVLIRYRGGVLALVGGTALALSLVGVSFAKDPFLASSGSETRERGIEHVSRSNGLKNSHGHEPSDLDLLASPPHAQIAQAGSIGLPSTVAGSGDVALSISRHRTPLIDRVPAFDRKQGNAFYSVDGLGRKLVYTIDVGLQERANEILSKRRPEWAALVAVRPKTGEILAMSSYSAREGANSNVATRATFPAASLIKVITAAAAVERAGMTGDDRILFRGGNYDLERYNYLPDPVRDRRVMTLGDALGRSVNPVFARLALTKLTFWSLRSYAERFGFNSDLPYDFPVSESSYSHNLDDYSYARTAAGFGTVFVSPVHAALIAGSLGNGGVLVQPHIISAIYGPSGDPLYHAGRTPVRRVVTEQTAKEVLSMMRSTVETGTARSAFARHMDVFRQIPIAGKTGTLSGENPKGMYYWFIGAAPAHDADIVVSALVIANGTKRFRGSHAASDLLDYYFRRKFGMTIPALTDPVIVRKSRSTNRSVKRSGARKSGGKRSAVQVTKRGKTTAKPKAVAKRVPKVVVKPVAKKPVRKPFKAAS
ncbi:MAG: hypothetical protein IT290_05270 [Deltaproteobacteria bacterium]|nr:hypothetical protein [Deltaproteobacteria bacterium]